MGIQTSSTSFFVAAERHTRRRSFARLSMLLHGLLFALSLTPLTVTAQAQSPAPAFEHRVVVATTSLDLERDVEASLERNVNQFAAAGFAVGAIVGGNGPLVDRLLDRKPYSPGLVDHGGHVFVIMHRPLGQPSPVREYRLLHTRAPLGVEEIVAAYGRDGFRLTVTAWEGNYFHAVFERNQSSPPVAYRVLRNAGRRGWDKQMIEDPQLRQRLQRIVPITLDSALLELGPAAEAPAEFVWESDAPNQRSRLEGRLNQRAATGFRVQLARMRGNVLDIALLKPAGTTGAAPALRLEDGPWGMPCSRGFIAGADIFTDGDVYCVAEDPQGPVSNRGFDLVVSPMPASDGLPHFGQDSCQVRALLLSPRPASRRVTHALQLEAEINRRVESGFRVTRAFAGTREDGDQRLVFFATRLPIEPVAGASAPNPEPPRLTALPDGLGQQTLAEREPEINQALAESLRGQPIEAWVQIQDVPANRYVLLTGCANSRSDRTHAEVALRNILARTPYSNYRIRNEILIDLIP